MTKPRGLSGAALREFRHKVSQLKKAGLTSKRTDARKQRPTRYYRDKVKSLEPFFKGEVAAVKIRPDFLKQYREAGFATFRGRVMVRKDPEEIASARRGMPNLTKVLARTERGNLVQRRIPLPASIKDIETLIDDLQSDPDKWDRKKRDRDMFAFTFMGNKSREVFGDARTMAEYLERYIIKVNSAKEPDEVFEGMELFSVSMEGLTEWGRRARTRSQRGRDAGRIHGRKMERLEHRLQADAARKSRERANYSAEKAEAIRAADRAKKAAIRSDLSQVKVEYERNNARRRKFRADDRAFRASQK